MEECPLQLRLYSFAPTIGIPARVVLCAMEVPRGRSSPAMAMWSLTKPLGTCRCFAMEMAVAVGKRAENLRHLSSDRRPMKDGFGPFGRHVRTCPPGTESFKNSLMPLPRGERCSFAESYHHQKLSSSSIIAGVFCFWPGSPPSAMQAWLPDRRVPKTFQAISLPVQCSGEASQKARAAHVMDPPSLYEVFRVPCLCESESRATTRPVPLSFPALVERQRIGRLVRVVR
jgi:hypothetical protein